MIVAGFDIAGEEEVWRPIPGFTDYAVSSLGRVQRIVAGESNVAKAGRILKPTFGGDSRAYLRVTLYRDGKPTYHSVHRLVLLAFVGDPPTDQHVGAHNDGNAANNTPGNLRWALPKENSADMRLHGTLAVGCDHPNSRLTPGQISAIRDLYEAVGNSALIARAVGMGASTIRRIVRGKSYA